MPEAKDSAFFTAMPEKRSLARIRTPRPGRAEQGWQLRLLSSVPASQRGGLHCVVVSWLCWPSVRPVINTVSKIVVGVCGSFRKHSEKDPAFLSYQSYHSPSVSSLTCDAISLAHLISSIDAISPLSAFTTGCTIWTLSSVCVPPLDNGVI